MGLIKHKVYDNQCTLGIWEITENYNYLLSKLSLTDEELSILERIGNQKRKLEWLSVRTLINILIGKDSRIVYNNKRKPFLPDNSYNISISHSNKLTSIVISREKKVGIDLEYMSHRISKVAHRFMHESEKITKDPEKLRYHLYIHWCAKEALYKICDKRINDFKNLIIKPFEPRASGKIKGEIVNNTDIEEYDLQYFKIDNYVIVWCCK